VREHNRLFCRAVAERLDCPGPVVEFGAFQVPGEEAIADLRGLFPGRPYVGCDLRAGSGVDRLEDVSAPTFAPGSVGTVVCLETLEHVFEVRRAFDAIHALLAPGGAFVMTSPFDFKIHAHPEDYWRMTPECLRRLLRPYGARLVAAQGVTSWPHTVMAVAVKAPVAPALRAALDGVLPRYRELVVASRAARPWRVRAGERLSRLYRSKGERRKIAQFATVEGHVEDGPSPP